VADEQRSRSGELDLDRFLTFLDAIVAIAITLRVLPLFELPMHVDEYDSVADLVRHNQAAIWAFLLSFVVVSRFWFVQHRAVRRMVGYHGAVGVLLALAITLLVPATSYYPLLLLLLADRLAAGWRHVRGRASVVS
jgi:uncharacterized membrane protein